MKTIGVIGGLGPQATMDFEARVHAVSQRLIPPDANRGYPPMLVYYHRAPPMVTNEDGSPRQPFAPDPRLVEAAAQLGAMCDFLVITANGVHMMQSLIEEASGRPVLSMVELALGEVRRRGLRNVGVMEFAASGIYRHPLARLDFQYTVIPAELQRPLDAAILACMEGRATPEQRRITLDAVEFLRARGADGIILGCTEIPLLLGEHALAADVIDPLGLLAEAAVREAISPDGSFPSA